MATHDYNIANQGFPAFRADLNDALAAIVSNNSNATAPATTFAHMLWVDTAANPSVLKIRNADNDAWVTIGSINQTDDKFKLTPADGVSTDTISELTSAAGVTVDGVLLKDSGVVTGAGTVSAPVYSTTGDLNTGIFFPSADQVGIATNGVERVEFGNSETVFNDGGADVDFRVEGDTNANLLFVDASADAVGIGTNTPSARLQVTNGGANSPGSNLTGNLGQFTSSGGIAYITFGNGDSANQHRYIGAASAIQVFGKVTDAGVATEQARLVSDGTLLVGRTGTSGQGVAIEVGPIDVAGVSGLAMHSAISLADDATITLSANTGLLVFIEYFDGINYPGAMFYCSYAGAVQLVSSSGGSFAATDSDGNACVFKGNSTDVVTVKNRLGSTRGYSIHTLHMRGQ
jgi:hypothetical protein